jgi:hypothetical protein
VSCGAEHRVCLLGRPPWLGPHVGSVRRPLRPPCGERSVGRRRAFCENPASRQGGDARVGAAISRRTCRSKGARIGSVRITRGLPWRLVDHRLAMDGLTINLRRSACAVRRKCAKEATAMTRCGRKARGVLGWMAILCAAAMLCSAPFDGRGARAADGDGAAAPLTSPYPAAAPRAPGARAVRPAPEFARELIISRLDARRTELRLALSAPTP